jgi:predicted CXXCH cytochrome family protein
MEKDFCLRCHAKVAATLEGKKSLHGPIQEGKCTPCHDPHGSQYLNLLKGTYPDLAYIPYDKDEKPYAFCLGCHEKNLLTFPDTTIYTKFRDGKNNLHYVHVANKRKGRTCRLCHEPHASANDHLVRQEGAKFGEWNIPLQFQATPTGGSCLPGCHGRLSYDRNSQGKSK